MSLKIVEPQAVRTIKVCMHEVHEVEPCKWEITGRRMYVDRDAPLDTLQGWHEGCRSGQMTIRKSMFDQIKRIVDQTNRLPQDEEQEQEAA